MTRTRAAQSVRDLAPGFADLAGAVLACTAQSVPRMAAVLALVMLPIIASVGFFLGVVHADGSLSSAFAGATFVALAVGVLVGALRVARDAEGKAQPSH